MWTFDYKGQDRKLALYYSYSYKLVRQVFGEYLGDLLAILG